MNSAGPRRAFEACPRASSSRLACPSGASGSHLLAYIVATLAQLHPKRLDVLVDASGARCSLLDSLGFSQQVCQNELQ